MLLSDLLPATISWQPADGDVVLLAIDSSDLALAEVLLAGLPEKARGQVFIEVDDADAVGTLAAPGRVCVTWLRRDRGQSLRAALDGYVAEMLPVDLDRDFRVYSYVSGDSAARVLTNS